MRLGLLFQPFCLGRKEKKLQAGQSFETQYITVILWLHVSALYSLNTVERGLQSEHSRERLQSEHRTVPAVWTQDCSPLWERTAVWTGLSLQSEHRTVPAVWTQDGPLCERGLQSEHSRERLQSEHRTVPLCERGLQSYNCWPLQCGVKQMDPMEWQAPLILEEPFPIKWLIIIDSFP